MRRRALLFVCFAALLSGGVACTAVLGDFSTGPAESDAGSKKADGGLDARSSSKDGASGHDDASRDSPSTMEDVRPGIEASTGKVTAVATGQTVYVGLPATVDASGSTGSDGKLTYKWTFLTEPAGSVLVDSNLSSTTAATPSFIPDLPGDFVLQVTVKSGAATGTATATVVAVAPQVFFLQGSTGASGGFNTTADASATQAYFAANYDGTNRNQVSCSQVTSGGDLAFAEYLPYFAGLVFDTWEGEAGEPPMYAGFTIFPYDGGGGAATRLTVGTSASSCGGSSPPVDLGTFAEATSNGSPNASLATNPRFNADGSRVVIYDPGFNVVTLATDGSGVTTVSPYFQLDDASANPVYDPNSYSSAGAPPSPQWLGSRVAWARPTATGWQIVTAPDTAGASVSEYMNCAGVTPREFQFLSDGTVIASYRATTSGPENIYQLSRSCAQLQAYTNLSNSPSAVASDFSISPDGNWLAFLQLDPSVQDAAAWIGELPGGYVYLAPIDGSTLPVQISADPAMYGPRWIGGGSLLAFTKVGAVPDGGFLPATSVTVYTVDGGGEQLVAKANGISTALSTGGSGACNIGGRAAGPGAFALLWVAAAVHFVRRRKRRAV